MSTILPPLPGSAAPLPNAGLPPMAVIVGRPPQALASLPPGTTLELTVAGQPARGMVQVMVDGAPMVLKLPPGLQLPDGARLSLQLVDTDGQPGFRLLAVNGRTLNPSGMLARGALSASAPAASAAPTSQAAAGPAQAGAATAATQPGAPAGLTATVIRPAGMPGQPAGAPVSAAGLPPDLPAGTRLTVRIAQIQPPGTPAPATAASPASPASPAPAANAPVMPNPAPQAGGTPAPSAGAPNVQATPPQPGASPQAQAAPPPAGPSLAPPPAGPTAAPASTLLAGTVSAHPAGGGALVRTPAGLLSLPGAQGLPEGGRVVLEVVGKPLPPLPPATMAPPRGLSEQGWPALADAAETLTASDQHQAAEQLMRAIPQATPRLAASLALFAGALRSGDFRHLAGEQVIKGLEKAGRKDLAERLKRDFAELAERADRPAGNGEWRAMTLPFLGGGQIEPVHLYLRRGGDGMAAEGDGGGARRGGEQRFILEVAMSRLGRIQLDGLVQREDKRFDLIVRTGQALTEDMRRDISGIFAEASALSGTKGFIAFQAGGGFIDLPPADAGGGTSLSV